MVSLAFFNIGSRVEIYIYIIYIYIYIYAYWSAIYPLDPSWYP